MGVLRRRHLHPIFAAFTFLLLASASLLTFTQLVCAGAGLQHLPEEGRERRSGSCSSDRFLTQKRQGGPGSSPPSCRSKCGGCTPCKPVHVPIHPGLSIPLEYYPEAWRCKCGNKLYMP